LIEIQFEYVYIDISVGMRVYLYTHAQTSVDYIILEVGPCTHPHVKKYPFILLLITTGDYTNHRSGSMQNLSCYLLLPVNYY
jgi:hypothetical protein